MASYNLSSMSQALPPVPMQIHAGQTQPVFHPPMVQEPSVPQAHPDQGRMAYSYVSVPLVQANPQSLPTSLTSPRPVAAQNADGSVYKDRQSIHISKLRHDIKAPQLKQLLSKYGQVADVVIKRGKEKRCSATAKYKKPTEALLAIQELNGKTIDGLELVVRHDRSENGSVCSAPSTTSRSSDADSTISSREIAYSHRHTQSQCDVTVKQTQDRAGPLVVNGARGPSHHRRYGRGNDDDSESAGDSSSEDDSGAQIPPWSPIPRKASTRQRYQ
ncbi:hypothetical protein H2198_004587 [Neophaeococcomyces mojaviensis]|uniref:Uncharacterized protein n=1 Tax=Neophaeococcomyces mojaviensis TaxID=3383035 RepID=A0ACC3A804_9EURO|nr:hypothetical protein H2198_004587 [Knufia sp. JES_112]